MVNLMIVLRLRRASCKLPIWSRRVHRLGYMRSICYFFLLKLTYGFFFFCSCKRHVHCWFGYLKVLGLRSQPITVCKYVGEKMPMGQASENISLLLVACLISLFLKLLLLFIIIVYRGIMKKTGAGTWLGQVCLSYWIKVRTISDRGMLITSILMRIAGLLLLFFRVHRHVVGY